MDSAVLTPPFTQVDLPKRARGVVRRKYLELLSESWAVLASV